MDKQYMELFKEGWYLVYTRLSFEAEVAERFAKENVQCFLPVFEHTGRWHAKRRAMKTPLFPSCIFVKLTGADDFNQYTRNGSLSEFLKPGRKPVWIAETIINQLRIATDKAACIYVSAQYFQPGEQIELEQGVLSGVSGELIQYNGKKKILIRVNILNRCILIDLPAEYIPALADIAC